jgi:hypothetical protein
MSSLTLSFWTQYLFAFFKHKSDQYWRLCVNCGKAELVFGLIAAAESGK